VPKFKSMTRQVQENLQGKLKIGVSKHSDKALGITHESIYSWGTFEAYLKHDCAFVNWAKAEHGCRSLEGARQYVDEYLQRQIDKGLSPYTQKLKASALAKLYDCKTTDFIKTQTRHRSDIARSRLGGRVRDKHFSVENNKELIEFCRATGLRRTEAAYLNKEQLVFDADKNTYHIHLDSTAKGGRPRDIPVVSEAVIQRFLNTPDGKRVWEKIHGAADIHSYRADFARDMYKRLARPKDEIPVGDRYCCRGDLKGIWYDKRAMREVSRALGHNRLSVIAEHYLYEPAGEKR